MCRWQHIHVYNPKVGVDGRNSFRFIGEVCPIDVTKTEKAAEDGFCHVLTDAQMRKLFSVDDCHFAKDSERTRYEFGVKVNLSHHHRAETLSDNSESSKEEDAGQRWDEPTFDSDSMPLSQWRSYRSRMVKWPERSGERKAAYERRSSTQMRRKVVFTSC